MFHYIIERKSWIALIFIMNLMFLVTASLDSSLSIKSTLYVISINIFIFIIFIIYSYCKESYFVKQITKMRSLNDFVNIKEPKSPFEKTIYRKLYEFDVQKYNYENKSNKQHHNEEDNIINWIHEIKTPLTIMKIIIDKDNNCNNNMITAWHRMNDLLDQEMYRRRFPIIQNDLFFESIDLKSILINEITPLKVLCMKNKVGFKLDISSQELITDQKAISFILRQILTNAIKYSNNSNIKIYDKNHQGNLYLYIVDQGVGISPEDLPRIFEKGFTSTNSNRLSTSTGMGLYFSKKLSEVLKIDLQYKSQINQGTTVILKFPTKNEYDLIGSGYRK